MWVSDKINRDRLKIVCLTRKQFWGNHWMRPWHKREKWLSNNRRFGTDWRALHHWPDQPFINNHSSQIISWRVENPLYQRWCWRLSATKARSWFIKNTMSRFRPFCGILLLWNLVNESLLASTVIFLLEKIFFLYLQDGKINHHYMRAFSCFLYSARRRRKISSFATSIPLSFNAIRRKVTRRPWKGERFPDFKICWR